MVDIHTLFELVDALTDEERAQLEAYLKQHRPTTISEAERIPDLFPGIWTSDDFDAELPEAFWMGDE